MASAKLASAPLESSSRSQKNLCPLCRTFGETKTVASNGAQRLVKCRACGVGFVDPLPSPSYISTHFKDHYITDDLRLEQVYGELRRGALRLVAAHVRYRKKEGRILDVGCAGGFFLDRYFRSAQWEKFGVEPSRYALRRALQRGIQTYEGDLLSVDLPAKFFDVITVAGVLAYFRDPRQELHTIRRALKSDGLLVLELPLGATQVWRHTTKLGHLTGGGTRSIFDSPHLYFYNLRSLQLLLRETGFRVERLCASPGNEQAGMFSNFLFQTYYQSSRLFSWISGGGIMLGPGVVICASPGA